MNSHPINLSRGWPNPSLIPISSLAHASASALSTPSISIPGLLYGPDPGYEPLRRQIAAWLTAFYQPRDAIPADRICITGGASQNLACILQVYSDPAYTRTVWMVAPTYFLACRIMEDAGFAGRLRGVPEDEEGVDLEFLRRELEADAANERGDYPVRPPGKGYRMLACSSASADIDILEEIQTVATVEKDIQACHLRGTNLLQPVDEDHVDPASRGPGAIGTTV